ncbi:hypothetical protein PT974_08600 [Cladobotryum mycophilum]|uniref:Uncharacterized protein n=1 Tax=Cladobotryum mycophilum TaxID=491253 RepID=A0ABR0SDU5_9HYPO
MTQTTPAAAAAARRHSRTGSKSIRGQISGPIPISSALDESLASRAREANFFVPVTKLEAPVEARHLENARRSFVTNPRFSFSGREGLSSQGTSSRDSDYWPTLSRLETVSPTSSVPIPPPRSEFRHSTISTSTPQRRRSTIRGAFSKLFGRKKTKSFQVPARPAYVQEEPKAWQHLSVPQRGLGHKRSATFPVTEYNRALRSHSIGPEDVRAIQSARNSLVINRKRAATSTIRPIIWNGPTGLRPRPASTRDRGSRFVEAIHDMEDTVPENMSSRSISPHRTPSNTSDEVRHASSSTSAISTQLESEYTGTLVNTRTEADETTETPAEPFTFEDITCITTIDKRTTEADNLQKRISGIENRLGQVETLLTHVCNTVPNFQPQLDDVDRPISIPLSLTTSQTTRPSTQSSSRNSGISKFSFGEASTVVGSLPSPTLRESTSLPTLRKRSTGSFTIDHYTALMDLIESDRSARLALEAQVKQLNQQIKLLTKEPLYTEYDLNFKDSVKKCRREGVFLEDPGIVTDFGDDFDDYSESFSTPREDNFSFPIPQKDQVILDEFPTALSIAKLSI